MAADVDVRVIKKTQETLGSVIKKPPLNEKLLKKPPFRFLHDIITNTIKNTSFFEGLYTEEELVSENVKEKDSKIAFLQKAIDVVSMVTGQNLAARPSKIVAGQEPTKTNEFLQALASALIKKQDSKDAVQRVLNGEKPSVAPKKLSKTTQPGTRLKDPDKKVKDGGPRVSKPADKSKDSLNKTRDASRVSKPRDTSKSKTPTKKSDNKTTKTSKTEVKVAERAVDEIVPVLDIPTNHVDENDNQPSSANVFSELSATPPPMPKAEPIPTLSAEPDVVVASEPSPVKEQHAPPSARPVAPSRQSRHRQSAKTKQDIPAVDLSPKSPKIKKDVAEIPVQQMEAQPAPNASTTDPVPRPQSVMRARSARPSTARPAPPRIINRNIVNQEETSNVPSAKPVTNLILDTDTKDNEEDQGFIVEDTAVTENDDAKASTSEGGGMSELKAEGTGVSREEEEATEQGSLVRQMLQTKKGLEGGSQITQKGDTEAPPESKPQSAKQRETTSKELEQLRQFIQTVSRSANPLGKMLDYLQEDIDSMNSELRMWRDEHQHNLVTLRREEAITDGLLDPLNKQLEELEQGVQDQRDQISALMAAVLHNDERIRRMLMSSHKA